MCSIIVGASKEARDKYWIDLLIKTEYLNKKDKHTVGLLNDVEEIVKLLTSMVKSLQGNKVGK